MQTNANLSRGQDGTSIQVLRADEDTVQKVSIGISQMRITLPAETDIVEVTVTADCYIKFGDGTVVASAGDSRALLRGTYVYATDKKHTHVSVIRLTASDSGDMTAARML